MSEAKVKYLRSLKNPNDIPSETLGFAAEYIEELENQKAELIRLLSLYIEDDYENCIDDLTGEACDYITEITQKTLDEILKGE